MGKFKLTDIRQHCFDLSRFFFQQHISELDIFCSKNISFWLHLASGVGNVSFNVENLNHSNEEVEALYRPLYEEERMTISGVLTSTTRFNHIWVGSELLMDSMLPKTHSGEKNKINKFCGQLKNLYEPERNLILYNTQLKNLRKNLRQTSLFRNKRLPNPAWRNDHAIGKSACGLSLVNKIRPYFAFGAFQVPIATKGFGEKPLNPIIIELSSRIVLLTLQMFLLIYYKNSLEKIDCWWFKREHRRKMYVQTFLRVVHLNLSPY